MSAMSSNPGDPDDHEFDWRWVDEEEAWVPPAVDPSVPSVARMYDYYLGGKDNFAVDRVAAQKVLQAAPDSRSLARANRGFLESAVTTMTAAGVRQFIDFGTGIPTSPNVHEIAHREQPDAHVVYLDNDPMVLVYGRALLAGNSGVACLPHDLRQPGAVLGDPVVRALIDFDRPVGLLFVAVLHFVRHAIAPEIVARYRSVLSSGSYLAVSGACRDGLDPGVVRQIEDQYAGSSAPIVFRTGIQIEQLFDGFALLEPGLTTLARWRTDGGGGGARCGVGRKP